MARKLWYISENEQPVEVFLTKQEALEEYASYKSWHNGDSYKVYPVLLDEIDDYPEEEELAEDRGLL